MNYGLIFLIVMLMLFVGFLIWVKVVSDKLNRETSKWKKKNLLK